MIVIVIFGAITCAYAGNVLNLGPLDIQYSKGSLSSKYYPMTANDERASNNAREFAKIGLAHPLVNPFKKARINPIYYEGSLYSATVTPSRLVVEGVKNAQLVSSELRMSDPIRADGNGTLSQLVINSDLLIDATIGIMPVFIHGHVKVILNNIAVNGLAVQAVPSGAYAIKSLHYQAHVDNVQVQLTLDSFKEFEDDVAMMKQLLRDMRLKIAMYVAKPALEATNQLLSKLSVEEVNQRLLQ